MWIALLAALIKVPIAGLMLWMPFRNDEAMRAPELPDSPDQDGGSKTLPGGSPYPRPHTPLPCSPRRGPHGSPSPPAPRRVRTAAAAASRRRVGISH
jgi:hypothetical protein